MSETSTETNAAPSEPITSAPVLDLHDISLAKARIWVKAQFDKRGGHSEMHVRRDELVIIMAAAFEHGVEHERATSSPEAAVNKSLADALDSMIMWARSVLARGKPEARKAAAARWPALEKHVQEIRRVAHAKAGAA